MIVDCAHYCDGARQNDGALDLEEAGRLARSAGEDFVWVGLLEPDHALLDRVARQFDLHPLPVEDARQAHQRPKLEEYGEAVFMVLRSARYDDEREEIDFGEIHVFAGPGYVVTVRHGQACELGPARKRLEDKPDLLAHGPAAVVWAVLDVVVDGYFPVADGLDTDVTEVEEQVFTNRDHPTERIYFLKREVLQFHRAVWPLLRPLGRLEAGEVLASEDAITSYYRDVADHARRIEEVISSMRELLDGVLQANATLLGLEQNETVQKISAWAAIIALPTLVSGIYGMNFENMPELGVSFGYPLAVGVMVALSAGVWRFFRSIDWL
ncbi:MAG: magnesium and cobalt transport protein CorA [Solirubrobacterales bacterium]